MTLGSAAPTAEAIPLYAEHVDLTWIGTSIEVAGYGVTEAGDSRVLRFAKELIVDVTDTHVVVHGGAGKGACFGDSGGPALTILPDGAIQTIGILDEGDNDCQGTDYFVRSDVVATRLDDS